MKKEVLIAIFVGFIIGLIITFGIITARRSLRQQQSDSTTTTPYVAPTTNIAPTTAHILFINSPQPNSLVQKTPFVISGSTTPGSMVAALTDGVHNSAVADTQGNFAITLPLKDGTNLLSIESYSSGGDHAQSSLKVIYLKESTEEATES